MSIIKALRPHFSLVLLFGLILHCGDLLASSLSDHIGPDPIQSDNCLIVTPGHSIVCRGDHADPEIPGNPTVTISCKPGVFVLVTHKKVSNDSSTRSVTLDYLDQELTQQWLAPSDSQSAILLFYEVGNDTDYEYVLRLIGSLLQLETRQFSYSINNGATSGTFEFTYSDRKLLELIAPSCN